MTTQLPVEPELNLNLIAEQIINSAQEGIIVYDLQLRYQVWNRYMSEISGVPADQVLGRYALDVFPFLENAGLIQAFQRVLDEQVSLTVDYPLPQGATREGWSQSILSPLYDPSGQLRGIFEIVRDITRLKQAEAELKRSEQNYRQLFEESPLAAAQVGLDFHFQQVNKEFCRFLGYDQEALLGMSFSDVTLEEDRESDQKFIRELITGECNVYFREKQYICADGSLTWGLVTVKLVRDQQGNPLHFMSQILDINRSRLSETALRDALDFTQNLMDASQLMIVGLDHSGQVMTFNRAAEEITGYSFAEIRGRSWFETIVPRERYPYVWKEFERSRLEGAPRQFENPILTKEGRERWINWHNTHLIRSGHNEGSLSFGQDITDQRQAEQELRRLRKMETLGQLAGGLAHDFNNILASIIGNIELAEMLLTDEPREARECIRSSLDVALSGRGLTRQLLTFAKGGEPVLVSGDLRKVLEDAGKIVLHGSNCSLEMQIADGLWNARMDVDQICQVLQNLVLNAAQSMPGGGRIRVTASNHVITENTDELSAGNYLAVTVEDSGVGISPENLGRIFEPYFTTRKTGTGLGLATAWSIIQKHRGSIEIQSVVGQGTIFTLMIPAHSENGKASVNETGKAQEYNLSGKRILVMDDELHILAMARRLLVREGMEVLEARDGEQAVTLFLNCQAVGETIDLFLLDLVIPGGMDGVDTVTRLRSIDPGILAIATSGYSSNAVMSDHKNYGFQGVLKKPYMAEELVQVLHQVLVAGQNQRQ